MEGNPKGVLLAFQSLFREAQASTLHLLVTFMDIYSGIYNFLHKKSNKKSAKNKSELNKKHDKVFGSLIDNDTFFQNESKNIISDYVMDSKNPSIQTDNKLDSHQKSRSNKLNSKTLKSGQIKVSNLDCELISEFW